MLIRNIYPWLLVFVSMATLGASNPVLGQFNFDDFKVVPELEQFNQGPGDPDLKISAEIKLQPGAKVGLLQISASMNEGWHVYSLTQPSGGPLKSTIKLDPSNQFRLLGSFSPDRPPYDHYLDVFKMNGEEFNQVTWSAPIEIIGSTANLKIGGFLEGQTCADGGACIPLEERDTRFEAQVSSSLTPAETESLTGLRQDGTHAAIRGWIAQNEVKPGETAQLNIAFSPDPEWHVYAYAPLPPSLFQKPTLIHTVLPDGWTAGKIRSASPIVSEEGLPGEPPIQYYAGAVTITVPIEIPEGTQPGNYTLSGHVAYQTCSKQCDRPTAISWTAQVAVVDGTTTPNAIAKVAFAGEPSDYSAVVEALKQQQDGTDTVPNVATTDGLPTVGDGEPGGLINAPAAEATSLTDIEFAADEQQGETSIATVLAAAFLGGFVLNFMPCVLPVIGLKILSFVDQAGSDRAKIFKLNFWYAIGMLAIFWILAALAAAPAMGLAETGLGWGEQFNYQGFTIPLICVVFVMALSFLDVWEIPIPGFATGSKATELSQQEGYSGAFFKGSITTLLATPCSAPGLGAAYAFSVNSASVTLPFLIFTVMGLGMAIPYLIIGAFPRLIRFLPKPGVWMDTFKQLMGFVLLATVIFLMQNVTFTNLLPTVGLLFGLWFACWWIGRVPLTATGDKRLRAWGIAIAIALVATAISFGREGLRGRSETKYAFQIDRVLSERTELIASDPDAGETTVAQAIHGENSLPWEPYSTKAVEEMVRNGQTVLVDFTADWCLTCRTLERTVLNTQEVRETVDALGVRTVIADWGTKDPEIAKLLQNLQGSRQIPFLAIFPSGQPEKVIRFPGLYNRRQLIDALKKAGPSQGAVDGPSEPSAETAGSVETAPVVMSSLP